MLEYLRRGLIIAGLPYVIWHEAADIALPAGAADAWSPAAEEEPASLSQDSDGDMRAE